MANNVPERIIDMHNHAIFSKIADADKDLSIGYDQIFALMQRKAEAEGKDVVIAITEHDNFSMKKEDYLRFRKKYPNVKIILGFEANADLTTATSGAFKKAHILVYADMSSEESINKWFDSKALQGLSTIKTCTNLELQKKVYAAKNILNKKLGLGITNHEIATIIVEESKNGANAVYHAFADIVKDKIKEKDPAKYALIESYEKSGGRFENMEIFHYYSKNANRDFRRLSDILTRTNDLLSL